LAGFAGIPLASIDLCEQQVLVSVKRDKLFQPQN
jgi:hypothetical protein